MFANSLLEGARDGNGVNHPGKVEGRNSSEDRRGVTQRGSGEGEISLRSLRQRVFWACKRACSDRRRSSRANDANRLQLPREGHVSLPQ